MAPDIYIYSIFEKKNIVNKYYVNKIYLKAIFYTCKINILANFLVYIQENKSFESHTILRHLWSEELRFLKDISSAACGYL